MLIELLFFVADHEVKYSPSTDVVLNEGRILHSEISHYIKKTKKLKKVLKKRKTKNVKIKHY